MKRAQGIGAGLAVRVVLAGPQAGRQGDRAARPPPGAQRPPGISAHATARAASRSSSRRLPTTGRRSRSSRNSDTIVLSRFAYLRRRGNDLVLELPRAAALFRICDPETRRLDRHAVIAAEDRRAPAQATDFPGLALLGLLLDCDILFKVDQDATVFASAEGDEKLVVWDFHDLLFHTRSTEGRQSSPIGGRYPHVDAIAPPPAVRAPWRGDAIDLQQFARDEPSRRPSRSCCASGIRSAISTRRGRSRWPSWRASSKPPPACNGSGASRSTSATAMSAPRSTYTRAPYPSAGSAYELELYLAVNACEGLPRGFYHYDAERHALVPIPADEHRPSRCSSRSAQFRHGCADDAANPVHHRRALSTACPGNTVRSPIR